MDIYDKCVKKPMDVFLLGSLVFVGESGQGKAELRSAAKSHSVTTGTQVFPTNILPPHVSLKLGLLICGFTREKSHQKCTLKHIMLPSRLTELKTLLQILLQGLVFEYAHQDTN